MSEPITLGMIDVDDQLELNLDALVGSHLGIVANAGGGKSGLIRRLLEQTHGRIQHIVLDIEDETYTLRERLDYVIAGGEGGDTVATPENAGALAKAALANEFSLICQLNDLGGDGAAEFVSNFLAAMISAPKEHWRPCLVVIDETQRFDPDSIRMLTERGRKRGFTAVLASQRLPKIDANIRGDLNNWIMGRVGQSLDRRIMADQLGFAPREANEKLSRLEPRQFWAFGPALARDPTLFRVGEVETTMVRPGQAKIGTPPPPEALRDILAALQPAPTAAPAEPVQIDENYSGPIPSQDVPQLAARDARIAELEREIGEIKAGATQSYRLGRSAGISLGLQRAREAILALRTDEIAAEAGEAPAERVDHRAGTANAGGEHALATPQPEKAKRAAGQASPLAVRSSADTGLNAAAIKMLDMLDRIAPARVTWGSLASMVGNKARGGNFNTARKGMRESGRMVEEGDMVRSSAPGRDGMTREEAFDLWTEVLSNPAPRMMEALRAGPSTREKLGETLGLVPRGGNWNNGMAQMIRNGVAFEQGGFIHLARPLPGEKP